MRDLLKMTAVALMPLLLAACEPGGGSGAGVGGAVPLGDYQLLSMGGLDVEARHVTLLLEAGRISGGGFCNRYSGPQAAELPALAIGPVVSTRRGCIGDLMAQDDAYFRALEGASTAVFANGRLSVTGAGPALVFEPHAPDP